MTNIVVLIKQVPDYGDRRLSDGDFTLDREGSDAVLDEINEKAVEEALQIKEREEAAGGSGTVTVLTAGPEKAGEAIRKALSMGADKAIHLGLPQLTHMRSISIEGGRISGERETDDGVFTVEASLPAVVSVHEKINEPRFPSFKGIMAAKKKEVQTLTLADIGVEADEVGLGTAISRVSSSTPKPPKAAGEKFADEGDGGAKIAEYLVSQKIV